MEGSPKLSDGTAVVRSGPGRESSFHGIVAAGVRAVKAVWLAPVLLFVLLAPQQTVVCAMLAVLWNVAGLEPPGKIAMGLVALLASFVVFVLLPWVVGGAAGRFADHLTAAGSRGIIEHANRLYGRVLVLQVLLGVLLMALFLAVYAVPVRLMIGDELSADEPDMGFIGSVFSHPAILGCTIAWWLAAATAVAGCALVVAAMALDDVGLFRALGRVFAFGGMQRGDAGRFWALVFLLGLVDVVLQQAFVQVGMPVGTILVLGFGVAVYNAYAILLTVAVAGALLLAPGPAGGAAADAVL